MANALAATRREDHAYPAQGNAGDTRPNPPAAIAVAQSFGERQQGQKGDEPQQRANAEGIHSVQIEWSDLLR